MTFDRENSIPTLSANELSKYAVGRKNRVAAIDESFHKVRSHLTEGRVEGNVSLSVPIILNGTTTRLTCALPSLITTDSTVTAEIIKSVRKAPAVFNSTYNAEFLAEGIVTGFIVSKAKGLNGITVRLTFSPADPSQAVSFEAVFSIVELQRLSENLLARALPFINYFVERSTSLPEEIKKLSFPYSDIRSGQHELMLSVMKTLRRGGKLVALAPTGTGKTIATLFPAVKALGGGLIDKIFYLTAKNETARAALDAAELLQNSSPHLRFINIKAKEQLCSTKTIDEGCFRCPRCNDIIEDNKIVPYKIRRNAALAELMKNEKHFTQGVILEYAEKYKLCPYELSLDLSELCDVIVCDYNYVYDSRVRLKRYFAEDGGGKYAFLVDEAHNLPDRTRAMYSADISPSKLEALEAYVAENPEDTAELSSAVSACKDSFSRILEMCRDNVSFFTDRKGSHTVGYFKSDRVPDILTSALARLQNACSEFLRSSSSAADEIVEAYRLCLHFTKVVKIADKGFAFLAEQLDCDMKLRFTCLDPSDLIARFTDAAHAAVMFSATLDPTEYFADMLGCADAPILKAEAPFEKDNLCVAVFDGISTRLSDRRDTAEEIASVISAVLEAREGNYFVFFPSYSYMKTVTRALFSIAPDVKAVMQKPDMTAAEREKFLSFFKERKVKNVVGLCVLGGSFSEGVDIVGDGLIGCIVVGAGLSGISSELNLISEYFDNKYGSGHLYAYEYPAINRIEQAAGRVIRSADDRGVVVLIDDRLSDPATAQRLPDSWQPIACTQDIRTLSVILEKFWQKSDLKSNK